MAVSCVNNQWGSWTCKPCGNWGGEQPNTDPNMSLEDAIDRCNGASMANPNPNTPLSNKVRKEKCTCSRAGMNKRYCDCKKLNTSGYMQKKIKQRNWAGSSASMGRGVSQAIPLSARGRYLNAQGVSGCPSGCSPCLIGVGS